VFAATEDWGQGDASPDSGLADRIERAARELAGVLAAGQRPERSDPYADPIPFEDLLAGR
jgi:FMN reductase